MFGTENKHSKLQVFAGKAPHEQLLHVQATGVAFPQVTQFWQGEKYRCMGAGVRTKKVAFVGVKVNMQCCTSCM